MNYNDQNQPSTEAEQQEAATGQQQPDQPDVERQPAAAPVQGGVPGQQAEGAPLSTTAEAQEADKIFGGANTPSPAATPAPESRQPSDDISAQVGNHIQESQAESGAQEADKLFGGAGSSSDVPTTGAAAATPTPGEKPKEDNKSLPSKILLDMIHGASQLPSEVAGGVLDAMHSGIQLAGHLESLVEKHFPNLPPLAHMAVKAGESLAENEHLDKVVKEPDSVTGKMVRGMAEFMTGFFATGEAGAAAGVLGKMGSVAESVAKGAVTDFTFFEGKSENLANLVEKFPKLSNPVTRMFETSPDDPELLARVKNAATGMGAGVATDALLEGFVKSVNFLRKAGGSSSFGQIVAKWLGHDVEAGPTKVQPFEVGSLGDPNGDLLTKKAQDAAEATAGIKPGDAIGQGPGYDINFAKINTSDDVKQTMRMMAAREEKNIAAGGAGTQTWEQTNAKAGTLDAFDVLSSRREGQALNASELVAARRMYVSSAEKLTNLAQIASQSPTQANLYMFERMAQIHSLVQKEVLGAQSEAGRALNILRQPVGGSEEMAKQISEMLDNMGGAAGSLDKANKIMKLAGTQAGQAGIDKFVQGSLGKNVKEAIDQAFVNGRFGQKTLVVKTVSDFANMGYQMLLRRNAEFISQKLGTEGGVQMGEAAAMAHGWVTANKEFLSQMLDNVKSAKSVGDVLGAPRGAMEDVGGMPFELPPTGKIRAENFNVPNESFLGKALNTYNSYTQIWGKGIGLVDHYSKMVGYRMELHAQAVRKASQEMPDVATRDTGAFQDRVAELIADPPADIHLAAVNQATYQTFTSKPADWLNEMGTAWQKMPYFGRMLLPFKTTPINILTQAAENSPLAPLVKSWRADLMAGGARADLAMAKLATGTTLFQTMLDVASKGLITGRGPEHAGERGDWERLGNQAYSAKISDTHQLAFNRLEPWSYHMGMAADVVEAMRRADETVDDKTFMKVLVPAFFSVANSVMSKTYMEGAIEAVKAFSGTDADREKWAKKQVGNIPSTLAGSPVNTLQQALDPYARVADGLIDALWKKIPGLSKDLPLQRNLWGEPLSRSSDAGEAFDAFSPYWLKTSNPQPIDKELERIKYFPEMPQKTIRDGGKTVEMNGHQYDRFMELSGNGLKDPSRGNLGLRDFLNETVQGKGSFGTVYAESGKLDAQDGGDRQKTLIKSAIKSYQDRARAKIVGEDGQLQASIDAAHAKDRIRSVPVKQRVQSFSSELKGD